MEFRVLLDKVVYDNIPKDDIDALQLSIGSFISAGFIECDENNEIYIGAEALQHILIGSAILKSAYVKYGQNDEGFVVYPFAE